MKLVVDNREVQLRDDLASVFKDLNGHIIEIWLMCDGIDIKALSDKELEQVVIDTLVKEVRELEYLSRPEVVQEAIDFARKMED